MRPRTGGGRGGKFIVSLEQMVPVLLLNPDVFKGSTDYCEDLHPHQELPMVEFACILITCEWGVFRTVIVKGWGGGSVSVAIGLTSGLF